MTCDVKCPILSHLAVVKSLDRDWDQFQKLIASKLGGKKTPLFIFSFKYTKVFLSNPATERQTELLLWR